MSDMSVNGYVYELWLGKGLRWVWAKSFGYVFEFNWGDEDDLVIGGVLIEVNDEEKD